MGNRLGTQFVKTIGGECWIVAGSFAYNATSDPVASSNIGRGWSVAFTSTGTHTITLADTWPFLLFAEATTQLAVAAARYAQIGLVNLPAKTIQIVTVDGTGAPQNVAAGAGNRCNFMFMFKNTGVP